MASDTLVHALEALRTIQRTNRDDPAHRQAASALRALYVDVCQAKISPDQATG